MEGYCSTIELHPQADHSADQHAPIELVGGTFLRRNNLPTQIYLHRHTADLWWRELDSNQRRHSQRVYSPSPLATRAPLRNQSSYVTALHTSGQPASKPGDFSQIGFARTDAVYICGRSRASMLECNEISYGLQFQPASTLSMGQLPVGQLRGRILHHDGTN